MYAEQLSGTPFWDIFGPTLASTGLQLFERRFGGVAGDKVLVTGASGFVGSAVARALIRSGYRVRALLRPTSNRTNLAGLEVEIVEGDMRDATSVSRAMVGARFLFHASPDFRLCVRTSQAT